MLCYNFEQFSYRYILFIKLKEILSTNKTFMKKYYCIWGYKFCVALYSHEAVNEFWEGM